ncbi:MAG: DegT/DnrJ/EryC1/StrS family aminotransferase [Candidatus Pacearchaeota archaeon]|jgi:CDP-6-deoxy-D-xylo-4-hexulose-3-dehydrase
MNKYKYYLAQDTIPKKHIDKAIRWLKTYPRLTQGIKVKEFESKWSNHLGVLYSTFVNSGSSANLLAYAAIKEILIGKGKPLTVAICGAGWSTTVSPAMQLGFDIKFVDVDLSTFSMDMWELEKILILHKISLVVYVPTLGYPGNMKKLLKLRDKYKFLLMEDACPAVGSKIENKYIGTLGDIGTFSFYYGHQFSTIEGGMVSTSNNDLNVLLKMIRSHGWSVDVEDVVRNDMEAEYSIPKFMSRFTFYYPGLNVRSTEFNAVLGLEQLKILDEVARYRHRNFMRYRHNLMNTALDMQKGNEFNIISCITYPIICKDINQKYRVVAALYRAGIETRPISGGNLGQQPFIKNKFITKNLTKLHTLGLVLPCHPGLSIKDIDYISTVVKSVA